MIAKRLGAGYRFDWNATAAGGRARMELLDMRGSLVAKLPRTSAGFQWNGRLPGGAPAPAGVYQARLLYETGSAARSLYLDPR